LANEVALIDQVRTELSLKQPERALQSLREHARRFSAPRLAEEALFLRTQALSQLGRSREANEELERFRRAYPGSVLPDPR
jgi:outer membrane protein assembly factor BamD (BamD/ComL family)